MSHYASKHLIFGLLKARYLSESGGLNAVSAGIEREKTSSTLVLPIFRWRWILKNAMGSLELFGTLVAQRTV